MTTFLLLHGYGGTHPEHWQSFLKDHLEEKGEISHRGLAVKKLVSFIK